MPCHGHHVQLHRMDNFKDDTNITVVYHNISSICPYLLRLQVKHDLDANSVAIHNACTIISTNHFDHYKRHAIMYYYLQVCGEVTVTPSKIKIHDII